MFAAEHAGIRPRTKHIAVDVGVNAAKTSSAYKAPASHQRNTRQIHRGLLTTSIQMTENMNQKNYRYGVEIGIIIEANALIKRNMDAENGITTGINASHTQPIRSSHQLNSFARTGMNIEGSASIMENTVVTNGTTRETVNEHDNIKVNNHFNDQYYYVQVDDYFNNSSNYYYYYYHIKVNEYDYVEIDKYNNIQVDDHFN
ncbi:MAG: hypothetical protein FE78DRAFT_28222 [Acidomyces sp. 'richmondensis']|nr:MAG: hypothetical protein FE78DRAFT_28222 [Acidomyces sp. 'richmondensis']